MPYLQDFIGSVASLPADLRRCYTLLGELDFQFQERQKHMLEKLDKGVKEVTDAVNCGGSQTEVLVRRHTAAIMESFKSCHELADHKVSLASQTYDLVDGHIQRLDKDLKKFEEELRRDQAFAGGSTTVQRPENFLQGETAKGGRKIDEAFQAPAQLDIDLPVDPNEPTYCICRRVSYGEMIACDNPECPIEWYHYDCVGITTRPRGKWYCEACSGVMKKRRGK